MNVCQTFSVFTSHRLAAHSELVFTTETDILYVCEDLTVTLEDMQMALIMFMVIKVLAHAMQKTFVS